MREIVNQIKHEIGKKNVKICFVAMMLYVALNFFINIKTYYGADMVELYRSSKLTSISGYAPYIHYFMQFLPIIVSIPVGFAFTDDKDNNTLVMIRSRMSWKRYTVSKLIATFVAGMLVFMVPLVFEQLLYLITFPTAYEDPSNWGVLTPDYIQSIDTYLFSGVYKSSPNLYPFFYILIWSFTVTLLSMLTMAVSMIGYKLKVVLLLPVYVLMNLSVLIDSYKILDHLIGYNHYLTMYNWISEDSNPVIIIVDLILVVAICLISTICMRRDLINAK